jgi:hypothetical protein
MRCLTALLLYLWICCLPPPTSAHHFVFKEIGEMAGVLSYVHAIVPVNILGLSRAIQNIWSHFNTVLWVFTETGFYRTGFSLKRVFTKRPYKAPFH